MAYGMRSGDWSSDVCSSGLASIERMAANDPLLVQAIAEAVARHHELRADLADFLKLDEAEQLALVQAGFVNFYPDDAINPYLPRSEEHTSELQSLMRISYAVFCLKKKTQILDSHNHMQ